MYCHNDLFLCIIYSRNASWKNEYKKKYQLGSQKTWQNHLYINRNLKDFDVNCLLISLGGKRGILHCEFFFYDLLYL